MRSASRVPRVPRCAELRRTRNSGTSRKFSAFSPPWGKGHPGAPPAPRTALERAPTVKLSLKGGATGAMSTSSTTYNTPNPHNNAECNKEGCSTRKWCNGAWNAVLTTAGCLAQLWFLTVRLRCTCSCMSMPIHNGHAAVRTRRMSTCADMCMQGNMHLYGHAHARVLSPPVRTCVRLSTGAAPRAAVRS